jgi:hypothetical protein
MIIDDYKPLPDDEFNICNNDPLPEELSLLPKLTALSEDDRCYVTNKDFNYIMYLMNNKIIPCISFADTSAINSNRIQNH